MEDDQQFCLRWNNHQSTLISVFDTLLENQTLVDCTLAAEGQFLKAHKVVLSACSPFFATLLQQQYDKHPIFILKDVKYQELRAMMDYMYRGEVNISQDQLAALLKAAESLQIKGLSDNRSGSTPKTEQHRGLNVPGSSSGSKLSGYTLEQTQSKRSRIAPSTMETADISGSREGSSSPSRRRRKGRRRSIENTMSDVHDNSNSSQMNQPPLQPQQQLSQSNASLAGVVGISAATSSLPVSATSLSAASSGVLAATGSIVGTQGTHQMTTNITKKTESVKVASDIINSENMPVAGVAGTGDDHSAENVKGEKSNHKQKSSTAGVATKETAEMVIEPKSEYEDEGNEGTVEDLTLDDEEMAMEDLDQNAGTSQAGEGSSQGYAPWQHDRSQDDILMAPQEAQQRDPQDLRTLYNIATAAAAVVAAASATNAVSIHNNNNNKNDKKQRHSISSDRNECNQSELNVQMSQHNLLTLETVDPTTASINVAAPLYSSTSGALSTESTPIQSAAPIAKNLLCDVLEPEISIRSMYKCCGTRFLQQQQQQQITPPPPPTIPVHSTSTRPASSKTLSSSTATAAHHNNCSGCQMTAAASIQLATLIGSTILMPQTVATAANIQDPASKAPVAGTDHNTSKKLTTSCSSEKLMCGVGGSNVIENNSCGGKQVPGSSIATPHHPSATKKATVQFHCEFCAFTCSWKYDLKLHLRQKHGIHNKKM